MKLQLTILILVTAFISINNAKKLNFNEGELEVEFVDNEPKSKEEVPYPSWDKSLIETVKIDTRQVDENDTPDEENTEDTGPEERIFIPWECKSCAQWLSHEMCCCINLGCCDKEIPCLSIFLKLLPF